MRLDWAILSNAAEARQGTVSILSAGWDTSWRPSFPSPFFGALTIRGLFHPTEAGRVWTFLIEFCDEDGAQLGLAFEMPVQVEVGPDLPPGWDVSAVASVNLLGLPIPRPGKYSIEILCEGQHLKSIPFRFLEGVGPTPPTT